MRLAAEPTASDSAKEFSFRLTKTAAAPSATTTRLKTSTRMVVVKRGHMNAPKEIVAAASTTPPRASTT
jgi:hypothetical protein